VINLLIISIVELAKFLLWVYVTVW